jgi:molybdopterin molybdotransferase
MYPLTELDEARELVLERAQRLPPEEVELADALGRVLAASVSAPHPVPPFDNSAMDGFAVRATDTTGASAERPVELKLAGESRAGRPAEAGLGAGEAIAISTGALIPGGADAVVPLEDANRRDGLVEVAVETSGGRFVRRRGDDLPADREVLIEGTAIGPAELGVLGSLGLQAVPCSRRPRVSLVISGDELAEPGSALGPGQIHDSNALSLGALTRIAGGGLVSVDHVGDELDAIRAVLRGALEADITVISGGVSVGEHDHVRTVLGDLGAGQVFWGLALKPGRPTWFGVGPSGGLVFGLPGNPVSAMVCFALLLRPAILAMQGADPNPRRTTAVLDREYPKEPGRAHAVRCALELREDGWHARPTRPEQASHVLTSMLGADALAMIPTASGAVPAGERVEIELLS